MGNLLRFLLFRLLPERLLPILTVWEVYQLVRRRHGPDARKSRAVQAASRGPARPRQRKPLW